MLNQTMFIAALVAAIFAAPRVDAAPDDRYWPADSGFADLRRDFGAKGDA